MAVGGFKQALQRIGIDFRSLAENLRRSRAGPDGVPGLLAGRVVAIDRVPVTFLGQFAGGGGEFAGPAEVALRHLLRRHRGSQRHLWRRGRQSLGGQRTALPRHDRQAEHRDHDHDQFGANASTNADHAMPPFAASIGGRGACSPSSWHNRYTRRSLPRLPAGVRFALRRALQPRVPDQR